RGELLARHLEAAVAVDDPNIVVRTSHLGPHAGRRAVAHRADAAGVHPGVRLLEADVLRREHLVLSHAGRVHGFTVRHASDRVDDLLREQLSVRGFVRVTQWILRLPLVELREPRREIRLIWTNPLPLLDELTGDVLRVADD